MTYWELAEEPWEQETDNWDGAQWITERGRKERLERIFDLPSNSNS